MSHPILHPYHVGVDLGSGLSKTVIVQQLDGKTIAWAELPTVPGPTDEIVKKNKYAIITIMLKQIASEIRQKYGLYVEAHPRPGINQVRLSVRTLKATGVEEKAMQVEVTPTRRVKMSRTSIDDNSYTAKVSLAIGNKVPRSKSPADFTFVLDDPLGTEGFENWVDKLVCKWFNVGTQEQPELVNDPDGSTEGGRCGVQEPENPNS